MAKQAKEVITSDEKIVKIREKKATYKAAEKNLQDLILVRDSLIDERKQLTQNYSIKIQEIEKKMIELDKEGSEANALLLAAKTEFENEIE